MSLRRRADQRPRRPRNELNETGHGKHTSNDAIDRAHQVLASRPWQRAAVARRFLQIHPFEDGNGRVGRAISSLVLIEDGWLPLTVTRTDRLSYIDALRAADAGDLGSLVRLVGTLQRQSLDLVCEIVGAVPDPDWPSPLF